MISGQFLHLPLRRYIQRDSMFPRSATGARDAVYGHPVVVTNIRVGTADKSPIVEFKTCTSFDSQPLGRKYQGNNVGKINGRNRFMLIDHPWNHKAHSDMRDKNYRNGAPGVIDYPVGAWTHPDGRRTLKMQGNNPDFSQPTYINLEGFHEIELDQLVWQSFVSGAGDQKNARLDDASTKLMLERVREQDEWEQRYGSQSDRSHGSQYNRFGEPFHTRSNEQLKGPESAPVVAPDMPRNADCGILKRFWKTDEPVRSHSSPASQRSPRPNNRQPQPDSYPLARTNNQWRQGTEQVVQGSQGQRPWADKKNWRQESPEEGGRPTSAKSDSAFEFSKQADHCWN